MNEAKQLVSKALACKMKADHKGAAEFYKQAVEIAKKEDAKNLLILDWFYAYGYCFYYIKDYETCKAIGIEYLEHSKLLNNLQNIAYAYDMIRYSLYYTPGYSTDEYTKWDELYQKANNKVQEETAQNYEIHNPLSNSLKAKTIMLNIEKVLKYSQNRTYSTKELETAKQTSKLDIMQLMKIEGFYSQFEQIAKKFVSAAEILNTSDQKSLNESGNLWVTIAIFCGYIGILLSNDEEIGMVAGLAAEKTREIFEKIDKKGDQFILALANCTSYLGSFQSTKEVCEKFKKITQEIYDEREKLAKEKEQKFNKKLDDLEEAKENLNERMQRVEEEQRILGDKFSQLEANLNIVQESVIGCNEKLSEISKQKENITDMTLLGSILEKERVLLQKKIVLRQIADNKDLSDYYNAILQDLEMIYIGARAAASGAVEVSKSKTFSNAASFASNFIEMIPMIGKILSSTVGGLATIGDAFKNAKSTVELNNISMISTNIQIYNDFCEAIALQYLKKNEEMIKSFAEAIINQKNWKEMIKTAISEGIEEIFTKILSQNDSKAKLKGKFDATRIINYFRKGYINIKPGEEIEKYVVWVMEEKEFSKEGKTAAKKSTGCLCFSRKKNKVIDANVN